VSDIDTEVVDSLKVPTRLMTASLIGRLVKRNPAARATVFLFSEPFWRPPRRPGLEPLGIGFTILLFCHF
jgi:hypothetical protein